MPSSASSVRLSYGRPCTARSASRRKMAFVPAKAHESKPSRPRWIAEKKMLLRPQRMSSGPTVSHVKCCGACANATERFGW